jgi:hypothetical protein
MAKTIERGPRGRFETSSKKNLANKHFKFFSSLYPGKKGLNFFI